MAKTVLVTGASGFIATHVVRAFLRRGYNVRGTVRSERAGSELLETHAQYASQLSFSIVPDIAAPNAFDTAVRGVDGVCRCRPWKYKICQLTLVGYPYCIALYS
jgi:nucleoside-diphosphate-sugar epimerase